MAFLSATPWSHRPVVTLMGLWAYAAATTIGPYLASRNGQTIAASSRGPARPCCCS